MTETVMIAKKNANFLHAMVKHGKMIRIEKIV